MLLCILPNVGCGYPCCKGCVLVIMSAVNLFGKSVVLGISNDHNSNHVLLLLL